MSAAAAGTGRGALKESAAYGPSSRMGLRGQVDDLAASFVPAVDQFEISGGVPLRVTLFAGKGDTGSVVLNASNQVIGLLLLAIPDEDLWPRSGQSRPRNADRYNARGGAAGGRYRYVR